MGVAVVVRRDAGRMGGRKGAVKGRLSTDAKAVNAGREQVLPSVNRVTRLGEPFASFRI